MQQWTQIEKLTRMIEVLTERLRETEAKAAQGPVTRRRHITDPTGSEQSDSVMLDSNQLLSWPGVDLASLLMRSCLYPSCLFD
jgi:hypothetical protein